MISVKFKIDEDEKMQKLVLRSSNSITNYNFRSDGFNDQRQINFIPERITMHQSHKKYEAISLPDYSDLQKSESQQENEQKIHHQPFFNKKQIPILEAPSINKKQPSFIYQVETTVKNSSLLPPITKSTQNIEPKIFPEIPLSKRKSCNNQVLSKMKLSTQKCKPLIFTPSKSLQLKKNEDKNFKDELYLPAFIRNFELPPKKKHQVVPTMDIFKKREISIKDFLQPPQNLKKYKILSHIGKGTFSIVSEALNVETHKKLAIKTYIKFDQIEDYKFVNIVREIQNMRKLSHHKNVVQIQSVIMDKRKVMLIMQNCGQQSLAGILRKKKILPEMEAKQLFRQIIQGISYCHEQNICHRDLKLQNILLDDLNCIKIIDFGFSSKAQKLLGSFCGTPPYMAPEIVLRKLYEGKGTDIWSVGVILYVMLYGFFPFRSNQETQLFRLIQQGKIKHNQTISQEAKQTINMMLKIDAKERATSIDVLNAKWLHN